MFDARLRRLIDPPLDAAGRRLAGWGLSANATTLGGFVIGLAALPLLAAGQFTAALIVILLNRLADGLDGAIARSAGSQRSRRLSRYSLRFSFLRRRRLRLRPGGAGQSYPRRLPALLLHRDGQLFPRLRHTGGAAWLGNQRARTQILFSPRRLDRRQRDHRLVRRRLPVPGGLSRARLDLRRRLLADDARPGAVRLEFPEAGRRC